jgi:hypothetical protein
MIVRGKALGVTLALTLFASCSGGGGGGPTASATRGTISSPAASAAPASVAPASVAPASAGSGGSTGGPVVAGSDLCGLLGPGDFAAVGVPGTGKAKENNADPSNVYCVYAGTSAGTGGVEFDAFLAGSTADSKASYDSVSAPMLDFAGDGKAAFPDADGASIQKDIPGGYDGIAIWKGKLVFDIGIPSTGKSKDQLIALAKLVLQRAAGLT